MPDRRTRRELLALAGASLFTPALSAQGQNAESTGNGESIVFNARVITVDSPSPRAQAFAVRNGRFTAVGSDADIRNLVRPGVATWDARGATIVPGFIDTHNHA